MSATENSAADDPAEVQNHWWWRPGWRLGRHFYACHLTFADNPALQQLVDAYQASIAMMPNLDLIPHAWLHLTLRGIGFVDEVSTDELSEIRQAVADAVAALRQPQVTFSRPIVRPEAVYLPAHPAEPLRELHQIVGEAIGTVRKLHELPEQSAGYQPHVSLAYVNADGPAEPIRRLLAEVKPEPVTVTISELPLLTFNRDHRMYQWTTRDPIPIGTKVDQ